MAAFVEIADLAWSPMRMGQLEEHHFANDGFRKFVGMALWPAAFVLQTGESVVEEALLPFVAGFGADSVFLTELAEVGSGQALHGEFNFFVHFTGIFPWHVREPSDGSRMARCYPCIEPKV